MTSRCTYVPHLTRHASLRPASCMPHDLLATSCPRHALTSIAAEAGGIVHGASQGLYPRWLHMLLPAERNLHQPTEGAAAAVGGKLVQAGARTHEARGGGGGGGTSFAEGSLAGEQGGGRGELGAAGVHNDSQQLSVAEQLEQMRASLAAIQQALHAAPPPSSQAAATPAPPVRLAALPRAAALVKKPES